jgi:shikimate kinase/3-dehydroquinate synthase
VLACGGGAFMDPLTREATRADAVTIWLRCTLPTLLRRVATRDNRPLLNGVDREETMRQLMQLRHPVYAEADVIVDCGDESPDFTTSSVLNALIDWKPARRLHVVLASTSYDVVIGDNLLARAGALLAPQLPQKRAVVITDQNVAVLHLQTLMDGLAETAISASAIVVASGEASKSMDTYLDVVDQLLEARVERRTAVIALGGGVVGDLAGFAAATTLRGLPFVQVPTTLLSQVDSSVGGKTGVNTRRGKNLVGAFYQPRMVLADTATLGTLPPRELKAGYAEVAKAGLIGDAALFAWCELHGQGVVSGDREAQAEAIKRACAFKAAVVGDDEREEKPNDGRALLNLGHTFGHALEAEYGYDSGLLHGEGVAIGLGLAFKLSVRLGLCSPADAERVIAHVSAVGLPADLSMLNRRFSAATLISHMRRDKKMRDGALHFVLTRGIGQAFTSADVPPDAVTDLLRDEGCDA